MERHSEKFISEALAKFDSVLSKRMAMLLFSLALLLVEIGVVAAVGLCEGPTLGGKCMGQLTVSHPMIP